jgi:hypothetical protein
VLGAILIVLVIFVIGPIAIFFGGAIWSLVTGWLSTEDADLRAAGAGQDSESA